MADSIDVLSTLKLVYTIYALIVISLIGWFALRIMQDGKKEGAKPVVFYAYIGVLVAIGTGLHFLTYNVVPWVPIDLDRANLKADKTFHITYKDHKIELDEKPMKVECGKKVVFEVVSEDLTYGFGLFRKNHTMVTQMQVVPGKVNDLMWEFHKNGTYYIRSTEYSGPKGAQMIVKDAVVVSGCSENDKYAMNEGGN
ncbi:cytochrome C oxidase subunit II [Hydrogenimonas thermophila]|uniref:Cytochrome c oxidase subunit 2 n=1 Tax=Hydrogenimonas thermophila TaxID=223786 RepID=A0A1I5R883_9BACT|nr:cytochrome C oxidase subunit II [Hydrogenimonas thermophila]SFP54752.1 cytochrome c oxidase subunit 2 [Hydrogenimonas thermophila]